jgi:hypothetical protein
MIYSSRLHSKRMHKVWSGSSLPVILLTAVLVLFVTALLTGCDTQVMQPNDTGAGQPGALAKGGNPHLASAISIAQVNRQLAGVRNVTAPYHDYDKGVDAGWSEDVSGCVEIPGLGGMGYHYLNPFNAVGDVADFDVLQPQVLMYEPQKNGKKRLVGVEYIIFYADHPDTEAPPVLFGQEFNPNPGLGLWALHVWIWKDNPNGIFADWNPKVSCKYD